jgi:hypothetical protein
VRRSRNHIAALLYTTVQYNIGSEKSAAAFAESFEGDKNQDKPCLKIIAQTNLTTNKNGT